MAESLLGFSLQFSYLFDHITVSNLIDMALVAVVFFIVFQALYQTRALQLLRGVIIAAILGGGLLVLLPLNTLNWLVRYGLLAGVIALPILFQDELRSILVKLGRIGQGRGTISNFDRFKDSLESGVRQLSQRQIGALIVLEGQTLLEDIAETGIRLGAEVLSPELLMTIFTPKTPLHDGAVIMRGDRLIAASCLLPIRTDDLGDSQLGTRHRAALGLSTKVPDTLVIIVSEETGWISIAYGGRLYLDLSQIELDEWINRFGAQLENPVRFQWDWLRGGGLRSSFVNVMISVFLAVIAWLIVIYQTNPPAQITLQGIPLSVVGTPINSIVTSDLPDSVNVQVQTTDDRIGDLSISSATAELDLTGLAPGVYSIPVEVTFTDPYVQTLSVKPKSVDTTLEQILTKNVAPNVTITDLSLLPTGYVVEDVSLSPSQISVSGPQSKLDQVASARIEITIGDRRAVFQEQVTPIMVDSEGKVVDEIIPEPDQLVATIYIRKTFFTREVGVQAQIDESNLTPGYEVAGIDVNPSTVTLAGPQSVLDEVDSFLLTAPILLDEKTSDFITDAPILIPEGISVINETGMPIRSVEVQVSISPDQRLSGSGSRSVNLKPNR